jgi:hypothetical protein
MRNPLWRERNRALWLVNAALRDAEVGNARPALQEVNLALGLSSGRDVTAIAAFTLARLGFESRSSLLVRKLKQEYPADTLMKIYWLP